MKAVSKALPRNQLGVLADTSAPLPPLSPDGSVELRRAFLSDLAERLHGTKAKITVLEHAGYARAFEPLFEAGGRAVVIDSASPDLPLPFIKRAFQRLKHRDLVIGPALDGGCYLVGMRAPVAAILGLDEWRLQPMLDLVAREKLSVALLPPWYVVHDESSLEVLRALCAARRVAGGVRLPHTERVLSR
jgi:glycosyltransferase A (GT-A) superfamily protein (DUF2064 family)